MTATGGLRLGFLGTGWIGLLRMQAMMATGVVEPVAVVDPSGEAIAAAVRLAPGIRVMDLLAAMLALGLDGIVIATPSALHAAQAIEALTAGASVYCQKPLGRSGPEVRAVVAAARTANRLLGVDLSYRSLAGVRAAKALIDSGALGRIYAADFVFHNAHGPDKAWFFDPSRSGGGCVIDLGTHLVDLAFWMVGFRDVVDVSARLMACGRPIVDRTTSVEDYATALIALSGGIVLNLACSWNLHAGRDAVIAATIYGTEGGVEIRNIDGSFYEFRTERFCGTSRETIAGPPDDWGGCAAARWVLRLADGAAFDAYNDQLIRVADTLDQLYERGTRHFT